MGLKSSNIGENRRFLAAGEVFESARLVALLDRVRATLPLSAQQDFLREKRRRDRLKDVPPP